MRESKLKAKLRSGQPVLGTMIMDLPLPEVVRAIGRAGFDFVIVDNEHAPTSLERNVGLYREAQACGLDLLVRVPDAEYHLIARTLDAGADGVMVPRVETAEQAQAAVAAAKYPPQGRRGCGQRPVYTQGLPVPLDEYTSHLNANTTVIIQVESVQAVADIGRLARVPGVDVALIGPADLTISLGVPGQVEHELMLQAVARVAAGCREAGIASGIHWSDPAYLRRAQQAGMSVIMCQTDLGLFAQGAAKVMAELGWGERGQARG